MNNSIKELRKKRKLTQSQLAFRLGISVVSLRAYENNEIYPKIDVVQEIMNALNCEYWELYRDGERKIALNDGTKVHVRTYFYLVEWEVSNNGSEKNGHIHLLYGKTDILSLTCEEYKQFLKFAVGEDLKGNEF